MATVYEGNEPYIFVSYSHKDKSEVMRYIDSLEKQGFLVWFDEGIEAGSEWPDYIAKRLADSECVLAFISSNFVESRNCRQELTFSQELGKEQLNVYIEQVELPLGMRMQLGLNQAIRRSSFQDEESFTSYLCNAKIISGCKRITHTTKSHSEVKVESTSYRNNDHYFENPEKTTVENRPSEKRPELKKSAALDKKAKLYGRICSLIEFAYIPVSIFALNFVFDKGFSVIEKIVLMAIPHIAIALINKLFFFRPLNKKYKKANADNTRLSDAGFSVVVCFIVSTVAAVLCSAFYLDFHANFLINLLISVGLNIIPSVGACLITLLLSD